MKLEKLSIRKTNWIPVNAKTEIIQNIALNIINEIKF